MDISGLFYQHEAVQCQNVLSPQTDGANNSILMCWVMTLWIPVNLCINVWNNSKNTWSTGTGEGSGENSFTVEKKLLNFDLASLLAKLLIYCQVCLQSLTGMWCISNNLGCFINSQGLTHCHSHFLFQQEIHQHIQSNYGSHAIPWGFEWDQSDVHTFYYTWWQVIQLTVMLVLALYILQNITQHHMSLVTHENEHI